MKNWRDEGGAAGLEARGEEMEDSVLSRELYDDHQVKNSCTMASKTCPFELHKKVLPKTSALRRDVSPPCVSLFVDVRDECRA